MFEPGKIPAEIIRIMEDYLQQNFDSNVPVIDYHDADELRSRVDLSIPENGLSRKDLFAEIEIYLKYSVRTGHKYFFNQVFSGLSAPALIGELVTGLTNTSMYTYEVAPMATLIELAIVDKMNSLVGFREGTGQFVTGGSNANLVAVLCARNQAIKDAKEKGLRPGQPLSMFVSDQAHYSFLKAANVLGIGTDNVEMVKSDSDGRMIPDELSKAIRKCLRQKKKPFFVAATAGTTIKGAFDPVREISIIAKQYNMWFHIDGAFGGSVLLSESKKSLLAASETADSFTWDPHKMMSIPLTCSVILMKDKAILGNTCSSDCGDYLFHDHENTDFDLGPMSLQCGRRVDALKLWLAWKYYGDNGYEERIDMQFVLADYATDIVRNHDQFELMSLTQSITVCFRYLPRRETDLNKLNLKIRQTLVRTGKCMINYCYLDGNFAFRLVLVNPELTKSDLDHLFDHIQKLGEEAACAGLTEN